MKMGRSHQNLYKSYDEEEELAKKRNAWGKTAWFFRKNYPPFLIGMIITASTVFAAASYRQRPNREALFSVSGSNILGDRSGSVSAIATVSSTDFNEASSSESVRIPVAASKATTKSIFPININTAAASTLDQLPGISPAVAENIVRFRQTHGPFKDIAELIRVSGIKEKRFAGIKDLVTVGDQK